MKVSIHQPSFLPWAGYIEKVLSVDKFIILDTVQFEKNSFDNRNKLRDCHTSHWLTVPVFTKGKFKAVWKDVQINNLVPWRSKHLKSIQMWYGKSLYFDEVFTLINNVYSKNHTSLFYLNVDLLYAIFEYLDIKTDIKFASEFSPSLTKSNLILELLLAAGATTYYSGINGQKYLDLENFKSHSINVVFQHYSQFSYKQMYAPFIPGLSIIDQLFSVGKRTIQNIPIFQF